MNWIAKLIGNNYNDNQINKLKPLITKINHWDEQWMTLTDQEIKAKTQQFKSRFQQGETLDDLLPEAFAAVKQACRRMVGQSFAVKDDAQTWDMVPYDVQLIWGIVLHQGKIAEMRTGEGKTLVATLPAYLNALSGNPVHVITVNDYLASRDAEWMGHLYKRLWLTVGSINKYTPIHEHKAQYEADIIYVESTEIGFDYLRDNLEKDPNKRRLLNRGLYFAIVDEADSVFIDEARTPMIMSQANNDPIDKYVRYAQLVQWLVQSSKAKKVSKGFLAELIKEGQEEDNGPDGDYYLDEKSKAVTLSEIGITKLETLLGVENLYRDLGYDEIHHIENALSAKAAYHEGKEYIIQWDEVMIVDENTWRIMPGRRFQWWLHQAIEAKEKLTIKQEAKTIATITYQHFFKLYTKLAGMTGTATTEWEELEKIYWLEVLSIPTNKPIHRVDRNDRIFFNQNNKWKAVIETVQFYHDVGQPILIGTSSIHTSELVSTLLRQANINHYVLNAKFFEQEATIVGNGGQFGSVVVATNMAGRGTDIKLERWLNSKIAANYAKLAEKQLRSHNLVLSYNSIGEAQLTFDELCKTITIWSVHQKKTIIDTSAWKNEWSWWYDVVIDATSIRISEWNRETIEYNLQYWLFVLGTEKHESRRIDNQLRGRAGRQGDPGVSQFYVSFDDEIMRKMGGSRMQSILSMAGNMIGDQGEMEAELSNRTMFTDSIVRAQTQMEAHNYSIRKHLYDYDSVVNKQRLKVYSKRDQILNEWKKQTNDTKAILVDAARTVINSDADYNSDSWTLNIQLADYLATLTQRVIVVTNAAGDKLDIIKDLLKDYNFEIFSLENNPNKTSSHYFTQALSTLGLDPLTTIYFDHKQENLDSAAQVGIITTWLHTTTELSITQLTSKITGSVGVTYDSIQDSPIYREVRSWIAELVQHLVTQHKKLNTSEAELLENLKQDFVIEWTDEMLADINQTGNVVQAATRLLENQIDRWSSLWDAQQVHKYFKNTYLDILDEQWIEHIDTMQHLRDKVWLYGYAQQDPLLIYKAESYDLFEQLWITIKSKVLNTIFRQIQQHDDRITTTQPQVEVHNVIDVDHIITNADQIDDETGDHSQGQIQTIEVNTSKVRSNVQVVTKADKSGKVWPNDPCPCGSGKKYKKCHGATK